MENEVHPDPFQDAMNHGLQRAVQVASCAVTAAQVYVHQKKTQTRIVAERDERARRALSAQTRADRDAARAGWAPALDPDWLRQADLFQACQAWGAAMPYANSTVPWYEPAAATATRKCEERLRVLHPHAMARYDRLRDDGMGPAEAMREAAPLFAYPPRSRDAAYVPRPELDAGNGDNVSWALAKPGNGTGESGGLAAAEAQEQRGRQIVGALQARARAQGRDPLDEAEQRTVLETVTNLSTDVIDRVVRPGTTAGLVRAEQERAVTADRVRAADLDAATDLTATRGADERTGNLTGARDEAATVAAATARAARTARPWEHDFPVPIQAVVASADPGAAPGHTAAAVNTSARRPARAHRPGP